MKKGLLYWVAVAATSFGVLLLILWATGVAPNSLLSTVGAGLAALAIIGFSYSAYNGRPGGQQSPRRG